MMREALRDVRGPAMVALAIFLLMWGVVATTSALSAARELEGARSQLRDADRLLRDAELTLARTELDGAVASASSAADTLSAWHLVPLTAMPLVGPNLRAARTLSVTARDVGDDLAQLLGVAAVIVSDDRTQQLGEISLTYLEELESPTRQLVATLDRSAVEVSQLDPDRLIGRIASAREFFLDVVDQYLDQALVAADLLQVLPDFLGKEEPRHYLVGAAALSELRGSGGLLGSWTMMTASEGRMRFEEFTDVDELPEPRRAVAAPNEDFERRYERWGALEEVRNVNMSPDFPAAAQVVLARWEAASRAPLDGVIVADTVVFERLAERSGGLDVPGFGQLAPGDTLRFVGLDAYDAFDDHDARKQILGATATAAFAELFQILDDDDVPRTVEMLTAIAEGGNLNMYVRDQQIQAVLERAGVAGELPSGEGESAGVFVNNFAENKIDYFAERRLQHRVRLAPDGVTQAWIDFDITNHAPREGHSRTVLGPWIDELEAGDNRSLVTFTCGKGCEVVERPPGSEVGGAEHDRPMVDELIIIRSGEAVGRRFETRSLGGWSEVDGQVLVEVQHLAQPTLRGSELRVEIELPEGYEVVELTEGGRRDGDVLIWEMTASGQTMLSALLDPQEDRANLLE